MIPVSLRMRNFMPFVGDAQILDFTPIHIACISGDNGAGKSSVIDAITWALWGKSRAKSDDDLIHQSASETEVEFHFSAGEHLYRVVRRRERASRVSKSGKSSMDLYISGDNTFLPISKERIRSTEKEIERILRMDYETFSNSAYLRQGHADEFTRQDPAKRKDVLARILGLEAYDNYEETSKEKSKDCLKQIAALDDSVSHLEKALAEKPSKTDDLARETEELGKTEKIIIQVKQHIDDLELQIRALSGYQEKFNALRNSRQRHEDDLSRAKKGEEKALESIEEYRQLLSQRQEIKAHYSQLIQKRQEHITMSAQARQLIELNNKRLPLIEAISSRSNELHNQYESAIKELTIINDKAMQIDSLEKEYRISLEQHQRLCEEKEGVLKAIEHVQTEQQAIDGDKSDCRHHKQRISEISDKLKILSIEEGKALCPLCESDIDAPKLAQVQKKLEGEKKELEDALSLTSARITQKEAILQKNKADLEAKRKALEKSITNESLRGQQLLDFLRTAQEAAEKRSSQEGVVKGIQQTIDAKEYCHSEQIDLANIDNEITALGYSEKSHRQLEVEIASLEQYETKRATLNGADLSLEREIEILANCRKTIDTIKARQEADNAEEERITLELQKLEGIKSRKSELNHEYEQLLKKQKECNEGIAVLKSELQELEKKNKQLSEKRHNLAIASSNDVYYKTLTKIFGKKGIQAMLIETALPEIEAEANLLLGRMTDGRMALSFETQRSTKKGAISETLDILIADELGTRHYEMFSGGEGFRIDFAIRIALSKLLARRAGAPLPTLIIDEGFGTQDADGIEKLKEAINSIQSDFQKILVITHIGELKDAFSMHINITKKNTGSSIELR